MKCIFSGPCFYSKLSILALLVTVIVSSCGSDPESSIPASSGNAPSSIRQQRGTAIGQIAPEFAVARVGGGNIGSSDLEGNPAVLVFWTAWCPVCEEEAPIINKLNEEFGRKGVQVVGINIGESDARIEEGIKDFGIEYLVAKDRDAKVPSFSRLLEPRPS